MSSLSRRALPAGDSDHAHRPDQPAPHSLLHRGARARSAQILLSALPLSAPHCARSARRALGRKRRSAAAGNGRARRMRISTLGRVAIALTHPPRKLTAPAASQRQSHVPNRRPADSIEARPGSALFARIVSAMLPNVIFEPQTSRGVYSPNSPKNSSMRYFNVSYHKNLLRLGAYCSPTPRLHALQVERILGMPRQQVIRGGGRLESKSKGPGAGPGPSEVAYRNLPLSDDGRRGLALADARPAARDAQKSQHCCRC